MSDDQYACLRAEHYDPLAVLSLQPLVHLDVPCPRNAPTAPTEARGLGERVAALADRMAPAVSGTPLDCKNTLLAEAAAPETEGQR